MAYDSTIPSLSNLIGDDIPQMQENFQLLEDSQVVDEGSTADGDYIRYENGWQICIGLPIISYSDTDRLQGTWTLPQSFVSQDSYQVFGFINSFDENNISADNLQCFPQMRGTRDTDEVTNIRLVRVEGTPDFESEDTASIDMLAIGRWE